VKKVFILNVNGSRLCLESMNEVLETLKNEFQEEEFSQIIITSEEMSEEEFKNLPEFDGF
jgi:F420-dependent methylenetetrahydromethanopterin dehydrogenase